jgi:hypothetical protein
LPNAYWGVLGSEFGVLSAELLMPLPWGRAMAALMRLWAGGAVEVLKNALCFAKDANV